MPGLGFQTTEVGFPLTFYLGFAPFIFIFILTNSQALAGDKHTHNMMLPLQYLKIERNMKALLKS
jgi:hypothetical protein